MDIIADAPIKSRLSLGYIQAASLTTATLDGRDRSANGFYTGKTLTITGGTGTGQSRTITGQTGLVVSVDAWTTQPDTTSVYEITAATGRSGESWRVVVRQWYSPIGNGSGGALVVQYDETGNGGWRDVDVMAPPGTPGQNGDDSERTFYTDNLKIISLNDCRTPPRPQDGNMLVPTGSHTGTDSSCLDVGARITFGRFVTNPAPWSILGSIQTDGRDILGNGVTYSQVFTRVRRADASQAIQGEFVIHPTGAWPFVFGGANGGGMWAQHPDGTIHDKGAGTLNMRALYQMGVPLSDSGFWTPTIPGYSGGFSVQQGSWHRTGDQVYIEGRLALNATPSASGNVTIAGLPFQQSESAGISGHVSFAQIDGVTLSSGYTQLGGKVNGQQMDLTQASLDGKNANYVPLSALRAWTNIVFGATYRV